MNNAIAYSEGGATRDRLMVLLGCVLLGADAVTATSGRAQSSGATRATR
jgi:hypothetical protein